MDITNFMNWFITQFLNLFKFIYNTLDNITFNGISLLQYTISVFVLVPILTVLFTLVTSDKIWTSETEKSKKSKKSKGKEWLYD